MRIHVQTHAGDGEFSLVPAQWEQAAARAGEPAHTLSFGASPEDWLAARADAELLVGSPGAVKKILPLAAPNLRAVFTLAAGVDALAPFGWLPPGVLLINNRGIHAPKAGEYVGMALLMLASRLPGMLTAQRAAEWRPLHVAPLAGRRATIVGTGDLGSGGARVLRTLGVSAIGVRTRAAPHPDFAEVIGVADLDTVLPATEFLVLACPLTPDSRGLLDRRRIGLLPAGAGVVNIGRGALLDETALCDALDAGHLSGAVLDVFQQEPLPPDHRMWRTPNLIVTPHVSCDDPATYNLRSLEMLFANLRALRAGLPAPNRVDISRGY